ncbi:hypothetical protein HDU97_002495 [Phlyctochytrium planicorne]|nr:hypothetical protein HDU97_002495 [Phlyctochytrium planicorne]
MKMMFMNTLMDVDEWVDALVGMVSVVLAGHALFTCLSKGKARAPTGGHQAGETEPLLGASGGSNNRSSERSGAHMKADQGDRTIRIWLGFFCLIIGVQLALSIVELCGIWNLERLQETAVHAGIASAWVLVFVTFAFQAFRYTHDNARAVDIPVIHAVIMFLCIHILSFAFKAAREVGLLGGLIAAGINLGLLVLAGYLFSLVDDQIETLEDDVALENNILPPSRIKRCNILALFYFSWMNPVMRMGVKRNLKMKEVPELDEDDKGENAIKVFNAKRGKYKSLLLNLFSLYPGFVTTQFFLQMAGALLTTAVPLCIYALIDAVTDQSRHRSQVLLLSILLSTTIILHALLRQQGFQMGRSLGVRYCAILINEIYSKSLRRVAKTNHGEGEHVEESASTGKIVSLMSSDAKKIRDAMPYLLDTMLVSIEIAGAVAALLYIVGWPGLVGLSVMVGSFPLTYQVSSWIDKMFRRLNAATDYRTTVINEVLQGIRIIKYFGWEDRFEERISNARAKELKEYIGYYIQSFATNFILYLLPNLVAYSTLLAITQWQGRVLDAKLAFTCLSLFAAIRDPMAEVPDLIVEIFQVKVAVSRIESFLAEDEFEHLKEGYSAGVYRDTWDDIAIGFRKGVFKWFFNPKSEKSLKLQKSTESIAKAPLKEGTDQSPLLSGQASVEGNAADDEHAFTLHELNLTFPVGKLTAICGSTGCGKSSLLMALLGEMNRISGQRFLPTSKLRNVAVANPSVAYVAQTSWLRNATIRENILFGEPYDANRYAQVIYGCSLDRDLATFEAGDLTEIGEKGINLSGGQKQRVSLARAAYSSAKFVLLDDPLSAVDAPTARHLLFETILGLMKGRTVLLVTHATHLVLPVADFVVVMEGGRVVADGGVVDVVGVPAAVEVLGLRNDAEAGKDDSGDFMSVQGLLKAIEAFRDGTATPLVAAGRLKVSEDERVDFSNGKLAEDHRLVQEEAMEIGSVKFEVYRSYIRVAGGWWLMLAILVVMVAGRFMNIASSYWIREWTNRVNGTLDEVGNATIWTGEEARDSKKEAFYFANVYFLMSMSWVILYVSVNVIRSFGSFAASKYLHAKLINCILHAPMRFFDTTPIGRILNRATGDMVTIDQLVMAQLTNLVGYVIELCFILAVVGTITPLFFVGLVPAIVAYYFVGKRYLRIAIQLKRLESVTRSPVYAMFSETLNGVSTIRAYSAESGLTEENLRLVEASNRAFFFLWGANRWLGVRLATISGVLVLMSGIAITLARDRLDAGLVGIALTWVIRLTDFLKNAVRYYGGLEMSIQTVERVKEYTEIEQEAPAVIEGHRPPENWPDRGSIKISNLFMRYSPQTPFVLKDISLDVAGGEKLGVVGRTGAGKSSLSLTLFRIVESTSGSIVIDGIDIATIGLKDLRTLLTIIPQDPVLFQGSVRSNLDPFGEHDDARILEALESVKFFDTLQKGEESVVGVLESDDSSLTIEVEEDGARSEGGSGGSFSLNATVSEGGSNFSQGQRQLLCLARALLKKTRIMVLDEATASVDNETDTKIQEAIRDKSFASTTVIAIAHRDKILVLDNGKVAQHGTPLELMLADGIFRGMCEEGGDFEELLATAKEAFERKSRLLLG